MQRDLNEKRNNIMSKGLYGVRKEIKDLYGKKEAIQYAKDVKSSTAFPGAQELRRNLSNSEIKVKSIKGSSPYKSSEAYKIATPSVRREAEGRLRTIQKQAARRYTRKVLKEAAKKSAKTLKNLSKATKATGIGMAIELGIETLKSKNLQNKISKARKELRLQNAKKG